MVLEHISYNITFPEFTCKPCAMMCAFTRMQERINGAEAEQKPFSLGCYSLKSHREDHFVLKQKIFLLPTHYLIRLLMQPSLSQVLEKWLLE